MERRIINSIIGRTIKEIRVMSFYINLKLVCNVISLYIKVDTGAWYKFTTSDGQNIMELLKEEPIEIMLKEIEDEFAYPIKILNLKYIYKRCKEIQEYMYNNQTDELNGFYIKLDDESGFSIFEEDGCITIFDGIKMDDEYSLVSCR
jgi:hypothetical protein